MIVSIMAPTFDLSGVVRVHPLPDFDPGEIRRRVNRVATLDGGVAINDRGFSHGDRDIVLRWRTVSKAHTEAVSRLVQLYALVNLSLPDGVYLAVPESFSPGVKESSLTLLVKSKLTP